LSVTGCPGGTATYQISQDGVVGESGTLMEGPVGSYSGTIGPLSATGLCCNPRISVTIDCPATPDETTPIDLLYIDPSGVVRTTGGDPIAGATITLLRGDTPSGPFTIVPDGSAVMSPANRTNPDTTSAEGRFGWDVIAGFYKVRAEKGGCATETVVFDIPPPVTDLDLRLGCPCLAPRVGCRTPTAAGKSLLKMKDADADEKDALLWQWTKGAATTVADFGDPTDGDAYGLCVYDVTNQLLFRAQAPAAGLCGTKPCWKRLGKTPTGFSYQDKDRTPQGLVAVSLKAGAMGKAKVVVKGKGTALPIPSLAGLALPIRVQLERQNAAACWEATFSTAIKSDAGAFTAKSQ
jgi:hypothetical protein